MPRMCLLSVRASARKHCSCAVLMLRMRAVCPCRFMFMWMEHATKERGQIRLEEERREDRERGHVRDTHVEYAN